MIEKAYSGDIIEIIKPDADANYKAGDIFMVDLRQSDMGACDDEMLMTTTDEHITDGEYQIIEKFNEYHFRKELNAYLSKSDDQILHNFKQGSQGEAEFNHFIRLIRKLI